MLLCREDLRHVVADDLPQEDARDANWKKDDRKAKETIILLLEDSQFPQRGDLEKHLSVVDELFDRLDAAGMALDKDTKICMVLRSLPPSYDGVVFALDNRSDDDISLDVIKSKLMEEYNRRLEREGSSAKVEAMRVSDGKSMRETRVYHFCKMQGHLKRNCRKFIASQKADGFKQENAKAKTARSNDEAIAFIVGEKVAAVWVIDSGASVHMTGDKSFFSKLDEFPGGWITLVNGEKTQIFGEGCGVLHGVNENEESVKIGMNEVKFVPGLATNLISVGRLAQKNLKVIFEDEQAAFGKLPASVTSALGPPRLVGCRAFVKGGKLFANVAWRGN
ncbi:uncharacterized protein LOC128739988 [Sabethes cyaneus]|uniref:uncharacterized protein LOC128739988 n=1 Tax=Sabethes cyaneus TaxID=53552 RepID=UPI00237EDDE9|nr:uncharacterized protein LOC128739988 [Sabethes cyaneus]